MNPAVIFAKYGALVPADSPAAEVRAAAKGAESCGITGAPVVPGEAFSGNESPDPGLAGCTGSPTGRNPSLEGKHGTLVPADSPAPEVRAAAKGAESCGITGAPVVPGEAFSGNESPDPGLAGCTGSPTGRNPSLEGKHGTLVPADSPAPEVRAAVKDAESCGITGAPVVPGEAFSGNESPDPGLAGCTGSPTGRNPSLEGQIHWRDYPAVVALSEFLRSKPMGISLARDPHWRIVLKARPAVSPEDSERWKFFTMAVALVTAANQDLKTLLENGAIRLPPTETSVFEPAKVLPGPRRCTGRGGAKFVHSESRKRNGKRKSS